MNRFLPSLSPAGAQWARLFGLLLAAGLLAAAVVSLRPVLTPLLAALALAYILNPLVTWFEKRGCGRLLTIAAIAFLGVFALLTLGTYLVSLTIEQAAWLRDSANAYLERAAANPASGPAEHTARVMGWLNELAPTLKKDGLTIANAVFSFSAGLITDAFNWLSLFVLLPMYTFFFLWRFNDMVRVVRDHLPAAARADIVYIVSTTDRAIATFFRGRLIICFLIGLTTGLGWTLTGVPFGLLLGGLAGLLTLVPFLSILALPPALLASYFVHAEGNWVVPVTLAAGVFAFVQVLDSFVFSPVVTSKTSGLHPLTTVVALLIGGQWAGMLGLILAIPVAGTLKALALTYVMPHIVRLAAAPAACEKEALPLEADIAAKENPIEVKAGR